MHDLYSSEIGIEAEIDYRRRRLSNFRTSSPIHLAPRKPLRVTIAEALTHLALHLDGPSVGTVTAQHMPPAGHGQGRPA